MKNTTTAALTTVGALLLAGASAHARNTYPGTTCQPVSGYESRVARGYTDISNVTTDQIAMISCPLTTPIGPGPFGGVILNARDDAPATTFLGSVFCQPIAFDPRTESSFHGTGRRDSSNGHKEYIWIWQDGLPSISSPNADWITFSIVCQLPAQSSLLGLATM